MTRPSVAAGLPLVGGQWGTWVWDMDSDDVTWTEGLYHLHGVEVGRPIRSEEYVQLVHPEDRERFARGRMLVGAGAEPPPAEYRIVRPDGEVRTVVSAYTRLGSSPTVVGMLWDVTAAKGYVEELLASRNQLRRLAAGLERAREGERTRLAREIHDELGQSMTALALDIDRLAERFATDPSAGECLSRMRGLVTQAADTMRRVQSDLRPGVLDELGLPAALEWLVRDFAHRTGIESVSTGAPAGSALSGEAATAVFRVLQEALANVARHSGARHVRVSFSASGGTFSMRVEDDGKGIDPNGEARAGSFGLIGVRERARAWGGQARVDRRPSGGTVLELMLPLAG